MCVTPLVQTEEAGFRQSCTSCTRCEENRKWLRAVVREIGAAAQRLGSADLLHTNIIGRLGGLIDKYTKVSSSSVKSLETRHSPPPPPPGPFLTPKFRLVSKANNYSGRKAPSLKMGSVCFSYYYYYLLLLFWGGLTSGLMLIGSQPPRDTFEFFWIFWIFLIHCLMADSTPSRGITFPCTVVLWTKSVVEFL